MASQSVWGGRLPSLWKAVAAIALAMILSVALAACSEPEYPGRPNATTEDYVGIWACYRTYINDHDADEQRSESHELDSGENQLLVIRDDHTAAWVITVDGYEAQRMEGRWSTTRRDEEAGTDSGIVFYTDDFENPLTYYESDEEKMQPHFVDERLVRGNLAIEYGDEEHHNYVLFETQQDVGYHRTDYFEKVSSDPDDSSWLSVGDAASSEATQFTCEASGVTYTIPAGWRQEDASGSNDNENSLAFYMLDRPDDLTGPSMAYMAVSDYSEDGFQGLVSSYEADEDTSVEQVELGGSSYWRVTDHYESFIDVTLYHLEGTTLHVFSFMGQSDDANLESYQGDFESLVASASYA